MPKKSTFTGIASVPNGYSFDVFGQGFNYRISKSNLFQQIESEIGTPGVQSVNNLSGALQLIAGTNMSIAVNSVDGTFTFNASTSPTDVQSISFDTSAGISVVEGQMAWNDVDKTLGIGLTGGVVLQVGQEFLLRALNTTGSTLEDGEAVYITGAQGNRTVVARAQADSISADRTIGIVTQSIANNQEGFVTLSGLVRDFDTSAWTEGDELWLSESVLGGITNVKPAAPDHAVHIGFVVRSSATVGSIFVRILAEESISELHDVVITSLSDRNLLIFDSASQTWENGDLDYGDFAGAEGITLVDTPSRSIDIEKTDASSAFTTMRNINGGVRFILGTSAPFYLQQTNASGTFEQDWARFNRTGGVDLFHANTLRFSTTSTGASVEGTTLEVNNIVYTFPAADSAGVLSSDGSGNLTWGGVSGQVFTVNAGIGSTPENGDRLSFGQASDHDFGALVIPRDATLILATGRFTNATDTITLRLIVNGSAQASTYDLSITGTAGSNEDVTVDVEGTPLSLSAGDSLNYEFITGAPTNAMDSASVGIWFIFD